MVGFEGVASRIKIGSAEQGDVPGLPVRLVAIVSSAGIEGYAITQDDGYYAIEGLVPLVGQLVVDHPDYESSISQVAIGNGSTQSQTQPWTQRR